MTDGLVVAGTGHRPPRLGLGYDRESRVALGTFAESQLVKLADERGTIAMVISGGAQGWDQAVGFAAHRLGLPYDVAVPFEGQESRWPEEARRLYQKLLAGARAVVLVTEGGHANWKFQKRDEYMVEHCSLLMALWDEKPSPSGTGNTVAYALRKSVPVLNVWPDWARLRGPAV